MWSQTVRSLKSSVRHFLLFHERRGHFLNFCQLQFRQGLTHRRKWTVRPCLVVFVKYRRHEDLPEAGQVIPARSADPSELEDDGVVLPAAPR